MKMCYCGRDCFVPRNDDCAGRKLRIMGKFILTAAFFATGIFFASAQKAPEKNWNSARIVHELKKMKHVGRVLYVAAHPDDENTQLISYLANDLGLETAYLSLTRGDGGQDLLGPEVREELGVIRTQELLMARSVDGGQQFFSRANDFGFSKTAAETFHIWDSTQVLSDMVWVIRKFKPDLIITRFSPTYAKTHGHHQASAMLAMVAFNAAADPTKFPEQLKYVDTWQAEGLYWNTSTFFFQDNKFDTSGLYHTNIGTYLPLLGKSVGELAAESRTMHKSQGMGTTPRRGDIAEYFVSLEGKKSTSKDIFQSINSDWSRIKGCEGISSEIDKLIEHFDMNMQSPEQSVSWLIDLDKKLQAFKSNYLVASKIQQIEDLILQCDGMYTEALSTKEFLPVGDSINLSLNILHQSSGYNAFVTTSLLIDGRKITTITKDSTIPENIYKVFKASSVIPDSTHIIGPYWLENIPSVGMYNVPSQLLRGLPQNPKQLTVHISYELRGTGLCNACPTITIEKDVPVFYKTIDPIKGEQYALARIVPPAVANPQSKLLVFNSTEPKDLIVNLKSFHNGKAHILLHVPKGWNISPAFYEVDMKAESEQALNFKITAPSDAQTADIDIAIETGGRTFSRSSEIINYDHIPRQLLLPNSKVKVVKLNIVTHPKLIGYIAGAGDDMPEMLRQIGYKVEMIPAEQLATINLQKYDAIIAGVRAYNTVNRLKFDNGRLMDYVKNGGNYIVQYNNNFRLVNDNIGPYVLSPSSDRTTEEDSKVTFLHPDNAVLNTPNKITDADFAGWVQERGLYYPDKWDTANYVPILQMGDHGEKQTKGALLIAKYGKGNFVYTGLSFFRELPAGVPGAFRLFANLIELEKNGK